MREDPAEERSALEKAKIQGPNRVNQRKEDAMRLKAFKVKMGVVAESYRVYRFRLLFLCQLIFSTLYDWGLPTWIIR